MTSTAASARSSAPPPGGGRAPLATRLRGLLPGLGLVLAIAVVATLLGRLVPVIGGPVFGIVIGAVLAAVAHPGPRYAPGTAFASRPLLQTSIVVLGTGLSLQQVARVGVGSLPVMLGTLAVALLGAWLVGRALGVVGDVRTLIGVGTGICGASAIAATTAVLGAAEAEVAYAIGTVFTFNVVAVLLFPFLGHVLGLSQDAFGLWAGTAVNDTSSVVAAAYSYGAQAGDHAVVVKLVRTLMIIPISVVLALVVARRSARAAGEAAPRGLQRVTQLPWRRMLPLFIVGFVLASALDTAGAIPSSWHPALSVVGVFLITAALSGIGLTTRLSVLRSAGLRPLALGAVLWVLVSVSSLGLQAATGTL